MDKTSPNNFNPENNRSAKQFREELGRVAAFSMKINELDSDGVYNYNVSIEQRGSKEEIIEGLAHSELIQEIAEEYYQRGLRNGFDNGIEFTNQTLRDAGIEFQVDARIVNITNEEDIESEAEQAVAEFERFLQDQEPLDDDSEE